MEEADSQDPVLETQQQQQQQQPAAVPATRTPLLNRPKFTDTVTTTRRTTLRTLVVGTSVADCIEYQSPARYQSKPTIYCT